MAKRNSDPAVKRNSDPAVTPNSEPPAKSNSEPAPGLSEPADLVLMATRYLTGENTQVQLADEYGVSPATISRHVDKVLSKGWVTVSVKEMLNHPEVERRDLSEKLEGRYPNVACAYVLDPPKRMKDYATWSDQIHKLLGRFLGKRHIKAGIRDNARIGVSSGRGVYYTIQGVMPERIRVQGATVLSLTGSFENRAHGAHEPAIMDGDTNAGLLALHFGTMVKLQTVGREIVVGASDKRPPWFGEAPDHALVGLGVLEPTNRILKGTATKLLQTKLDALYKLVAEVQTDSYLPCADMCNCMIWVPPPEGVRVERQQEIRGLIEEINAQLCVIPFTQLLKVKGCWIATGGVRKAHALDYCLKEGLQVNALCVDTMLAEALLALPG